MIIYRYLKKRLSGEFTCEQIISTISGMMFHNIPGSGWMPMYTRSAITDALHDSFGFHTDYQIVPSLDIKKFVHLPEKSKKYSKILNSKSAVSPLFKGILRFPSVKDEIRNSFGRLISAFAILISSSAKLISSFTDFCKTYFCFLHMSSEFNFANLLLPEFNLANRKLLLQLTITFTIDPYIYLRQ